MGLDERLAPQVDLLLQFFPRLAVPGRLHQNPVGAQQRRQKRFLPSVAAARQMIAGTGKFYLRIEPTMS